MLPGDRKLLKSRGPRDGVPVSVPLQHPLSPVAPTRLARAGQRRPWEVVWAGGAGMGGLLALGTSGQGNLSAAVLMAGAVGALTVLLARQAFARHGAEQRDDAERRPSAQERRRGPPHAEALERLEDPVVIVSAREADDLVDRRVAYANAAARELLRIQGEGGLLVTALRNPEVLEAVDASLFGGVTEVAEYETGGAQSRAWRAWITPLSREQGGDVRHALLVLRDETDVRRSQRMNADFLANASHELRTPLASLSGFIETLRGHAKDDEKARDKFLAIMGAQAERMARLIDDLLSLSRIELNEHVPPSGEADLAAITRDVADALSPQALARRVRVELRGADQAAPVEGERDQVLQVVQNLLDNALKYTPADGTVTMEIASGQTAEAAAAPRLAGSARLSLLTPDRAERRYALVRVTDEGPGIGREHLPRLTERFYRVEGQKSGERSGTGLGLAIVKHVVNRHRGGLAVESLAGQGATFTAYFPQPARTAGRDQPSNVVRLQRTA